MHLLSILKKFSNPDLSAALMYISYTFHQPTLGGGPLHRAIPDQPPWRVRRVLHQGKPSSAHTTTPEMKIPSHLASTCEAEDRVAPLQLTCFNFWSPLLLHPFHLSPPSFLSLAPKTRSSNPSPRSSKTTRPIRGGNRNMAKDYQGVAKTSLKVRFWDMVLVV